jgi:hypothetical protein
MGAYSSFAMLGLTHHVIVQIAAIRAGISGQFRDYCVLGDDVVIANEAVASEYVKIMISLGLDISEGKSINSTVFTEFAKKLRGPTLDISPIGAGLVLHTLRNKFYICVLVYELLSRNLVSYASVFPHYFDILPKKFRKYRKLVV